MAVLVNNTPAVADSAVWNSRETIEGNPIIIYFYGARKATLTRIIGIGIMMKSS